MLNLLLLPVLALVGAVDAGSAFSLLKVPVGPRACAMGEAYTGLSDDIGALFWNPAGLGRLERLQFGVSHHEWFGGIRDENVSGALPLGPGFLGFGAVYSGVGDIEIWDPENNPGGTAAVQGGYAVVGYGLRMLDALYCGASVKGLYDHLVGESGFGACADVGVLYRPLRWLSVGAAGLNLGPGAWYEGSRWPLPMQARFGIGVQFDRFRVLTDAALDFGEQAHFHLGGEYDIHRFVTLRAGARLGPQDWRTLGWTSIMTGGIGLHYDCFALDYAIVPYGPLGLTHRIALRLDVRADIYGTVAIEVREFGTGVPVEAAILPEWVHQGMTRTDPAGTFELRGIEPGWLKVSAVADGYLVASESVLVEPHRLHRVRLTVRKSGMGSLWGAVYERTSGRAVAALVACVGPAEDSVETDPAEGSFTFRKLPAGEYTLSIRPLDPACASRDTSVSVIAGRLTSVAFYLDGGASAPPTEVVPGDEPVQAFKGTLESLDDAPEAVPSNAGGETEVDFEPVTE